MHDASKLQRSNGLRERSLFIGRGGEVECSQPPNVQILAPPKIDACKTRPPLNMKYAKCEPPLPNISHYDMIIGVIETYSQM